MAINLTAYFTNATDHVWNFQDPSDTHGSLPTGGDIPAGSDSVPGVAAVTAQATTNAGPSPEGKFQYLMQGTKYGTFYFEYDLHDGNDWLKATNSPSGVTAIIGKQGGGVFTVTLVNDGNASPSEAS